MVIDYYHDYYYFFFLRNRPKSRTVILSLENPKHTPCKCPEEQTPSRLKWENKISLFELGHVSEHCIAVVYERKRSIEGNQLRT